MSFWLFDFHAFQKRFRQRLENLKFLRVLQCERERIARQKERTERQETARSAWEKEIAEAQAWRDQCLRLTCPYCGVRAYEGCCKDWMKYGRLQCLLRRMAGINPRVSYGDRVTATEWADWNRGKDGGRACGPASWDNAVRAIEDG